MKPNFDCSYPFQNTSRNVSTYRHRNDQPTRVALKAEYCIYVILENLKKHMKNQRYII